MTVEELIKKLDEAPDKSTDVKVYVRIDSDKGHLAGFVDISDVDHKTHDDLIYIEAN